MCILNNQVYICILFQNIYSFFTLEKNVYFEEDCLPLAAKTLYITLFVGKTGQIIQDHISLLQKIIK